MATLPEEVLYDVRLIERHIRQGLLTREEVEKRRAQLRDAASEGDALDLEELQHAVTGERRQRAQQGD